MEDAANWMASGFESRGIDDESLGVQFLHLLPNLSCDCH
jgi:hypothetical protein